MKELKLTKEFRYIARETFDDTQIRHYNTRIEYGEGPKNATVYVYRTNRNTYIKFIFIYTSQTLLMGLVKTPTMRSKYLSLMYEATHGLGTELHIDTNIDNFITEVI